MLLCFLFLCIQTSNLSSIPYGFCPCMMCSEFREKCDGVKFPQDGVSDARTCRRDIRLYLYISKVHLLM
jgi:hypothetical protein